MLIEEKVTVEVLKSGLWAQEPWLPQIEAAKGNVFKISIGIAHKLAEKGKCRIIKEDAKPEKRKYVKKIKNEEKMMKSSDATFSKSTR